MINIRLPDGNTKTFEEPVSGLDIAQSISEGFARNCVAMELDHNLVDLDFVIDHDADIRLITTKDKEGLEILRHSAAHLMAQAILRIFKDAKLTIGPAVEDGFYYDIDMEPVSEDDFPKIEAEIKKIIKEKLPVKRREVSKAEALEFYRDEPYKLEMISELEEGTINVRVTLAPSSSLDTALKVADKMERVLMTFPEVKYATSRVGRAEIGGDPEPVSNTAAGW